ncbi:hypothetical protein EGJ51_17950 [Pseudomonas fulva]|uniref:Uncharacterized protein n=1 Tax=Pseudomonas parafulva TaxID=157782 RepID=A0AAJ0LL37_9PSED|nr:hypothetical protein [Pseudomonas fulva]KTT16922.1 hypothetical protein NS96R_14340 [Pseudomonas parafulva]RRW59523.1 hypothetical protein EGJ51_17950 [Pseudomonas fulva]
MINEAAVPIRRLSQDEVRQAGPELAKSGFVTGDAHDATVAVLLEQIAVLRQNPTRPRAEDD